MLPSTHKLSASAGASHKKYQRKSLKMMKRTTLCLLATVIVLCSNVSRSQATGSQVVTRNDGVTYVRVAKHGELRFQHVSPVTAPEIDPALATDGLLLLVGCVAILRGRRRVTEP